MRKLKINKIEGIYAICTDPDQKFFAIPISELPPDADVGDSLAVDDEAGTLAVIKKANSKKRG